MGVLMEPEHEDTNMYLFNCVLLRGFTLDTTASRIQRAPVMEIFLVDLNVVNW